MQTAPILIAAALLAPAYFLTPPFDLEPPAPGTKPSYHLTRVLSFAAQSGQAKYLETCAACHGREGQGTAAAPPLARTALADGLDGRRAFHEAFSQTGAFHEAALGPRKPGFNAVEKIAKFVRETSRRHDG